MSARQALELATRGGAAVLGRADIGFLATGKCADLIAINLNRLDYAGALHDPVAAVLFCAPQKVDFNIVGGKFIVKNGELTMLDLPNLVTRHNQAAKKLVNGD
jgi:cytosine/adenosine deaminase-related metal-dependent hydrolase